MKVDDTLFIDTEHILEPISIKSIVGRLSRMGGELLPYEIFTSKLGVGDVIIERLPNSLKIQINWNDSEAEPVELYIVDIPEVSRRKNHIEMALMKYLVPSLIEG